MKLPTLPCFKARRRRIWEAHRHARESEQAADALERQWPEVRALSTWARETRERNHLTELFIASRGNK